MNMLATEWSNPRATNAEIGNQTATIFPAREAHPLAMYTAIQTSQLQRIPLTKATSNGKEHFAVAMATPMEHWHETLACVHSIGAMHECDTYWQEHFQEFQT